MIQSTELRIGNYCLEDGKMYQVTLADFYNMHKDDGANRLQPIPLTEEILLRCGFEKIDKYEYEFAKTRIQKIIWQDDEPEWKISKILGSELDYWKHGMPPITNLHTLQNLYFALTGEELICNLK